MESNLKHLGTLYIIVILLTACLFIQRGCSDKSDNTQIVTIPEIKGKFDTVVPKEIEYKTKYKYVTLAGDTIVTENPINDSLVKQYETLKDSVSKFKLFVDATKIRQYNEVFEDSVIKISTYAETSGKLLKMAPSYVIKERKQSVNVKQTVFALYAGGNVYNTLQLDNGGVGANLYIQNKKGDLYNVGYDINKNIYLGYTIRIFDIKR